MSYAAGIQAIAKSWKISHPGIGSSIRSKSIAEPDGILGFTKK
jgi:hypothetical protein